MPHIMITLAGHCAVARVRRPDRDGWRRQMDWHEIASSGNAEAELDRQARQMQSEQRITYAEAYRRVLIANPRLYTAHLEQHSRQTGG